MATVSHSPSDGLAILRGLLATVRRAARRWVWIEALAWVGLCGGAVFWALLAFDWAVEPPPAVRGILLVAALAGLAWLLWSKLAVRLATPLDDGQLAMIVERGHPAFRDSLATAIDLGPRPHPECDPVLLGRTIDEAAAVAPQVDVARLFRGGSIRALALAGVAATATIAGLAVARPAVADVFVRRVLLLRDDPWPRRTQLTVEGFTDGVLKVARGADVDIVVRADATRAVPRVVDLRTRGAGRWQTERMGMRGGVADGTQAFGHMLRGVTENLDLEIRGGDARIRGLAIRVLDAPAVADLRITYTLPEYLGGGRREAPPARLVQVPSGSRLEIAATSTKPLRTARIVATSTAGERQVAALEASAGNAPASTVAGDAGVIDEDLAVAITLEDTDGLGNREPIGFLVTAVPDAAPTLALRLRGISTAVTPRARLPVVGAISDDHGLVAGAVVVERVAAPDAPAAAAPPPGAATELPIARVGGGASLVDITAENAETVALEPLGLSTGGRIAVVVRATDGCGLPPGPNTATSDVWTLAVVSADELMAMLEAREILLRRRFESVVADLAQARDRVAAEPAAAAPGDDEEGFAVGRLGESAARAAGETGEIAAAFRDIRLELDNNALLTPELESRLVARIADPLAAVAATDLPALAAACRERDAAPAAIVERADAVLARLRAILDTMIELESYNEVLELLRGVIKTQEEIRAETLEWQKRRAREALERP